MYRYIVIVDHLGSMDGPCYIQNRALMKHVIKRSRCTITPFNNFVSAAPKVFKSISK